MYTQLLHLTPIQLHLLRNNHDMTITIEHFLVVFWRLFSIIGSGESLMPCAGFVLAQISISEKAELMWLYSSEDRAALWKSLLVRNAIVKIFPRILWS